MRRDIGLVLVAAMLVLGGFGAGLWWSQGGKAADGEWSTRIVSAVCSGCDTAAQPGEADGNQEYLNNVIARLERDGCTWQVAPASSGVNGAITVRWVVISRC